MSIPIHLKNGNSSFTFLSSGDRFEWLHDSVMINSFRGNQVSGSPGNLYLRIYHGEDISFYPLMGLCSRSNVSAGQTSLTFTGTAESVHYRVVLRLTSDGIWFYDISLSGQCRRADVICSQDIGAASRESILTNELYTSQYLGHSIFQGNWGYVICSRQNMSQNGSNPYLQQGSIGIRSIAYSTDGTQFFGLSYKKTNIPEALRSNLPSVNKQFELSHIALQTEAFAVDGPVDFSFYGICRSHHPEAISALEYQEELMKAFHEPPLQETSQAFQARPLLPDQPYASPEWTHSEIQEFFPERILEEIKDGVLYSFFTPENEHVVLQAKELVCERPHGHILLSDFDLKNVPQGTVSTTNYMYGIFNCQFIAGNTNLNKFISNHRGLLNFDKTSGQRIYVRMDGEYRLLTLPAAYKMTASESTWYYTVGDDVLIIRVFAVFGRPEMALQAYSRKGRAYDFLITTQFTGGTNELDQEYLLEQNFNLLSVRHSSNFVSKAVYPGLHFTMRIPEDSEISDSCLHCIELRQKNSFELILQGLETEKQLTLRDSYDCIKEAASFRDYYQKLTAHFHLSGGNVDFALTAQKLNVSLYWYAHDALIHFASPHGLEQSGGAAWGTRDVCQGPLEFFLTSQHYELVRNILLNLFSHQIEGTWEWPQWFMFDRYEMHQAECHGDVIFWPLKAVSDYILATGDASLLGERVAYRTVSAAEQGAPETILSHLQNAVTSIKTRFLPGTRLISYAGGDWDDTLQPASRQLKEHLVSAWTQALAVQTFSLLSRAVKEADGDFAHVLEQLSLEMKHDFQKYLIKDNVIAGFLYLHPGEDVKYMLHPEDQETNIHYRLLPLTRSILAEIADPELAKQSTAIIDRHLACPDGIRLMDAPAGYEGGVSRIFLRAEQAANIGREISLQYVHAHIRYIEAMAALGLGDKAWKALMQVNPVLLTETVKNAMPRQSNTYFSSSDGCFTDRYEYARDFHKLREGSISVKGGWRLYSSGPGIYYRRVIADLLGIRFGADTMTIDPVPCKSMDNAVLTLSCFGRTVNFLYHVKQGERKSLHITSMYNEDASRDIPYQETPYLEAPFPHTENPYRQGGLIIPKNELFQMLDQSSEIHITITL